MKIADFFVALGFDIKGKDAVDTTDKSVQSLNLNSLKLLAGVTALNGAFYTMMALATRSAVELHRFAITTGQSTDDLQRWKAAAERGNVAGAGMVDAVKNIQRARTDLLFGNGEAAGPWVLLGIDPRQDPFKVLDQLKQKVRSLDPAVAGHVLRQAGFSEDMLYLLKQPNFGVPKLPGSLNISREEIDRLWQLGGAWKEFLYYLGQVGTRFAAQFAEPLTAVLKGIGKLFVNLGMFVNWLERGSSGATAFKYAVLGILVALASLSAVIAITMAGPFGVFIAAVGGLAATLGLLVVTVQDFWVACRGGDSAFNWNDNLIVSTKNVEELAGWMGRVVDLIDKIKAFKGGHITLNDALSTGTGLFMGAPGSLQSVLANAIGRNYGIPSGAQNTVTQTFNFSGQPMGAPEDLGRVVRRSVSDAFAQQPQPTR